MTRVFEAGDAERIPYDELSNPNAWYIPHFGVYHPKKPGKIRMVFDCSAKTGGVCLNDFLLNSLLGILLRFRKESVAITCNVERMFHQFKVPQEQRDFLHFLWYDSEGNVVTYRMKVHLFGATSPTGCDTYGLRARPQLATGYHSSDIMEFIKNDFYVDDGLTNVPIVSKAKELVTQAVYLCQEGNLRLHKFSSNNKEVLESIPETERSIQDVQSVDPDVSVNPVEGTFGIGGGQSSPTVSSSMFRQNRTWLPGEVSCQR